MKIQSILAILTCAILSNSCLKSPPAIDTIAPCEGTFYANSNKVGSIDISFNFIEFSKPRPVPFIYIDREGPNSISTTLSKIRSNFSAYDKISNSYVFAYYYQNGVAPVVHFHHHSINTSVSTFTTQMEPWVCPVFLNGKLYGIRVIGVPPAKKYEILEINPITGQRINTLSTNNITVSSSFSNESMSGISDGGNNIYFLSGTNLIIVNTSSGNATHKDIDLSFNPNNNIVQYYGLEYKKDENILLAMKKSIDKNNADVTELVTINLSSTLPVVKPRFQIHNYLPSNQDKIINPEFYSSTFDSCDATYYITEMQNVGSNITSNLFEINLKKDTFIYQPLVSYWYGLEFRPK